MKRSHSQQQQQLGVEILELQPLGAGCEVGRSCHILRYKGKTIMLDCGILPSFFGVEALPLYLSEGAGIDPASIDIIFITHFHLDHCAALPHFTERMRGFKGRIFATHPTVAVMQMILRDFIKVTAIAADNPNALYSAEDIDACIAKIEMVDLRQKINVGGVQFMLLNAGHVLGAAMVMIEMGGVRILYTGDYSCEEDRHLAAAECPKDLPPNVLIVEATYGMQVHESRVDRERRFCEAVEKIVKRGGRCLIPIFALGRAQELMLILEEYWHSNPSLQSIPVYYANKMAENSLEVYRTYISHMNARVQQQVGSDHNPWRFEHIKETQPKTFKDVGPCVMLASPGMLQSGFSRNLFDSWCEDAKNGVVLAGYSVEGTLARTLETNPLEVESAQKKRMIRRISIDRVSFAAHADSAQTSNFVDQLRPDAVVLVHGEKNEMRRLCEALGRKQKNRGGFRGVYMPENNTAVKFRFQEEKIVRLIGKLAEKALRPGVRIQGILVHHEFETLLLQPSELARFTPLATHSLRQRLHVPYRSSFAMLKAFIIAMYADTKEQDVDAEGQSASFTANVKLDKSALALSKLKKRALSVANGLVLATHYPPDRVVLSWSASPIGDMVADSLVAVLAQAEVSQASVKASSKSCSHDHSDTSHTGGSHVDHQEAEIDEDEEVISLPLLDASLTSKASTTHSNASEAVDIEAATKWTEEIPWARDLLQSDSSLVKPESSSQLSQSTFPTTVLRVLEVEVDSSRLIAQLKRRRDILFRMLCDQYGHNLVSQEEEVIITSTGDEEIIYCIHVSLDDKSAKIKCSLKGFTVEAKEGDDTRVRLGSALERACDLVSDLYKPVK
jgi:cleavage and polyadenylation specificity factor subunit 3